MEWIRIEELIEQRMIRDRNYSRLDMPMYLSYGKRAIREMKLHQVRQLTRRWVNLDPNLDRFQLPEDVYMLATISYEDDCGKLKLYGHNSEVVQSDIIDVDEASKCCDCDCGCNSEICKEREFLQTKENVTVNVPISRVAPIVQIDDGDSSCVECEPEVEGEETVIDDEIFEYESQTMEKVTRTEICTNGDVLKTTITPTAVYKRVKLAPIENCTCDGCENGMPCKLSYRIAYSGIENREEKEVVCAIGVKDCGCPVNDEQITEVAESLGCCGTQSTAALTDLCCGRMTTCCPPLEENFHIVDGCMVYMKHKDCYIPKRALITYYTNEHYTDTKIPDWVAEYLLASIRYYMSADDRSETEYFVRRLKTLMNNERDKLSEILLRFTFTEFAKSMRFGNRYEISS